VTVEISTADAFFSELEEKVTSLVELEARHPVSAKLAAATLKRYLPDQRQDIRLFDLVNDEVKRVEVLAVELMRQGHAVPSTISGSLT
jgi:hypothetical protein